MNSILAPAVLLASALFAEASVYVTNPVQGTVCNGGQACPVQFVDNGESPLLSAIGTCDVGLYTGEYVLVQDLGPVDVSSTTSFSFTPNPDAGPNGPYYLVFSNPAIGYTGFSGSFTLGSMTGTTPGGGGSSSSSGTESPTATGPSTTTPTESPTGTGTETTGTGTTPTGTETTPTTTPTAPATTTPATTTPVTITTTITTTTSHTTTTTSHTTTSSASSTPSNAAVRDGSSGSLAVALFLACAGALAL